ncbi:component of oligomeric golgi complex 6 [Volvox carteri f. nagariensis]|uniref:Conserved oligomeric Golgi complex subunit 6 n=1 Tax=Volvox carteri f. nagariensis TaxID=3068 RepID=D8TQS3_VOLCA|nr:component of oligomeric golgi complex 6 [Volvox carteri f. nagariensis]EFJ50082.1 component of oligomeric golgi complex 6 [Volvox carteri f. nagariensis]|eukprot:XP_002948702.1 component of oligomeric golgi complex 6 [Volvox carteri f. nagariensis]
MASNSSTGLSAAPLAPGLARKVKKVLDIKTDSPELLSSLQTLSSFYTENTPAARRGLRTTIEKRGLAINERFIGAAESVIKALDEVQRSLDLLSASCSTISHVVSSTKTSSSSLLADTERLSRDLEAVERKQGLVAQFLDTYQLTPEEVAALQGEEINPAFFSALSRVRTIHDNCRQLLRTHHQRAGLELMDLMASHQESAYERLCRYAGVHVRLFACARRLYGHRWVQVQCRNIGEYDAPEVEPALQTAVAALRERPVLFKYCAEEVATARHNSLFQRFITALTRGGPGGVPRPIEIHAHDPQRYVNDMLAWVHQALASEREFVVALFGEEANSAEAASEQMMETLSGSDSLHTPALLDRIFDSICRPLKLRVEQVLMTSPPTLLCFSLGQLLSFYHGLVMRILGPSGQLTATLASCRDMATRVFFEQLRARGDRLRRNPPPPPKDLSPPPQVAETVHHLLEILNAYESAMESRPQPQTQTPALHDLGPVLSAVLDPLAEMCDKSAEALTPDAPSRVDEVARLDPAAHRIYLINCLAAVWAVLQHRAAASARARQVLDSIEAHTAALVGSEVGRLLARCGMAEDGEEDGFASSAAGGSGSPASDPALSLPRLAEALRSFFVLVSSPDALPEFNAIQVPRLRADAVSRVCRSLLESYEVVYNTIEDPRSGYLEQGGASVVKHTPAQVRTILGVV